MSIMKLTNALLLASESGIQSITQLRVFLLCAENEGRLLTDITGLNADSPEFRVYYHAARKLMLGERKRGYNGLRLLQWGDTIVGKERAVLLTHLGRKVYAEVAGRGIRAG